MYHQYDITDRQTGQTPCQVPQQPLIQRVADDCTLQRAYTWLRAQQPGALPHWDYLKSSLSTQLRNGEYCFQPVTLAHSTNRLGEPETQEVWHAQDQLVLKAMSLVLTDALKADLPTCCHHLDGRAGMKQTLRQTRDYLQNHSESWVMTVDVKGYYTQLDHAILYQQLHDLFPQETYLLRLLWLSLKRTVSDSGNYEDIERGISLGGPLSPLMAALYLKPLDDYFAGTTPNPSSPRRGTDSSPPYQGGAGGGLSPPYQGGAGGGFFYARFLDEWIVIAPTRWQLHNAMTPSHVILEQLQLSQAPDQMLIGRASHGFDFLGYHLTPTQLTVSKTALQRRDTRLHRLYLPRPLGEGRGKEKDVSRWQQYLSRPLRESQGAGQQVAFNPLPQSRLPNHLSFEAKFLALGTASLLSTVALNSQATIYYVDLTAAPMPVGGWGFFDLDCDGSYDFYLWSYATYKARGGGGVSSVGISMWGGAVAYPSAAQMGLCEWSVGGGVLFQTGWYVAGQHWVSIKTGAGRYGMVRISTSGKHGPPLGEMRLGVTGVVFDDSTTRTTMMSDAELPATANATKCPWRIVAPPPSTTKTLSLVTTGTGHGTVNGAGSYAEGAAITLGATPDTGSTFAGWTPDSCKTGMTLTADTTCTATFNTTLPPPPPPLPDYLGLLLQIDGTGHGKVTSDTGLSCQSSDCQTNKDGNLVCNSQTCSQLVKTATTVTLTPQADSDSVFSNWKGNEDCIDGKVVMKSDSVCIAVFQRLYSLTVAAQGPGYVTGYGYSDPQPLIDCGSKCQTSVSDGMKVSLQATPTPGMTFSGWSGECGTSTQNPLTLEVTKEMKCLATFAAPAPVVTPTLVTSTPPVVPATPVVTTPPAVTTTPVTVTTETPGNVPTTSPTTPVATPPVTLPPVTTTPPAVTTPVVTTDQVPTNPTPPPVSKSEDLDSRPVAVSKAEDLDSRPVAVTPAPVVTLVPVTIAVANFSCVTTGDIGEICNYGGQEVTDLNVLEVGIVSNGVVNTTVVNTGWVSNFHITATGKLSGGVVTGYIVNEGVMLDFEFVGMSIIGGTLGGVIQNNSRVGGYFQDVTLQANTKITGGRLRGIITGNKNAPALLENVQVMGSCKLSGVKLGKNVKLEKGVKVEN